MQIVPTKSLPSQTLTVLLENQACQIDLAQRSTGLFISLYVGGTLLLANVICQNRNRIVRSLYLGFVGDLMFIDTAGNSDPFYTGLGDRFVLAYLLASELPEGEG